LKLQSAERDALAQTCPYFPASYLDYLSSMQLHPQEQVKLHFIPKEGKQDPKLGQMGTIECSIEGYWRDVILYEVPILAIGRSELPLSSRLSRGD
jgi:nicotinate phosphoribosyltransferase